MGAAGPIVEALPIGNARSLPKTERRLRIANDMLSKVRMKPVHAPDGRLPRRRTGRLEGLDFDRVERVFGKIAQRPLLRGVCGSATVEPLVSLTLEEG